MTIRTGAGGRGAGGIAALAAAWALFAGIWWGTFAAGGSDSYGYVSEARMLADGRLSIFQPLALTVPWPSGEATFTPLGYAPARRLPGRIVPTYPPGLPLTMALALRVAGDRAVFLVVPILGGCAVWFTFLLGRALAGPAAGALASALLATSPIFLYQVVQPMSDVPATAWWLATLVLCIRATRVRSVMAGALMSIAILTRPNLAPLAVTPALLIVLQARAGAFRETAVNGLLFIASAAPGVALLGWLNSQWYGSWHRFGYGRLDALFSTSYIADNLRLYGAWLAETHTPLVIAGLAAPLVVGRFRTRTIAWICWAFAVGVLACYLVYLPFDAWWYLRFLLPGLAVLFALVGALAAAVTDRVGRRTGLVMLASVGILFGVYFLHVAQVRRAFDLQRLERRYPDAGRWVADRTPAYSVVLAAQHSGSVRYYSNRLTLRWDVLDPGWLDSAVLALRHHGYFVFAVLEPPEEPEFRRRFPASEAVRLLDGPPAAIFEGVRIYELTHYDSR